jgi:hypothetical protein
MFMLKTRSPWTRRRAARHRLPRPIDNPADQHEVDQHVSVRINKPDTRTRDNGEPHQSAFTRIAKNRHHFLCQRAQLSFAAKDLLPSWQGK